MRQGPGGRAMRRHSQGAGQGQRVQREACIDLLPEHAAGLGSAGDAARADFQGAKTDDGRGFEAERPDVQADAQPGISNASHDPLFKTTGRLSAPRGMEMRIGGRLAKSLNWADIAKTRLIRTRGPLRRACIHANTGAWDG